MRSMSLRESAWLYIDQLSHIMKLAQESPVIHYKWINTSRNSSGRRFLEAYYLNIYFRIILSSIINVWIIHLLRIHNLFYAEQYFWNMQRANVYNMQQSLMQNFNLWYSFFSEESLPYSLRKILSTFILWTFNKYY